MKPKKLLAAGLALTLLLAVQAQAQTFTYADNWINWPGYTSSLGDENGNPTIDNMVVDINENNQLNSVKIYLHGFRPGRLRFDSLFISTGGAWDSWNYFVHDGGSTHSKNTSGDLPGDGLWSVNADYDYTKVINNNRVGNPNGIDAKSLSTVENTSNGIDANSPNTVENPSVTVTATPGNFGPSISTTSQGEELTGYISYVFNGQAISINPDEFFVAYAPYCANDIIGGGTAPVPEPATMLLFGTGLAGLASAGRKKMKRA